MITNPDTRVFQGAKVVITGGIGFIGSNLAIRLLELGAHVTLVDSLVPEYGGNLFNVRGYEDRLQLNISDVRDEHSLKHLLRRQNYLFNLAGQTSHMDSMKDPFTDLEINCKAQLSLLEVCRKHNPEIKVVYASTRQVYGRPDYLPVDEKHLLRPVDVNGINKMAGEWYHVLYNNVHGIRSCVLRLTNTYGPRMRVRDARQTFLGIWIRLLLEGKPFEVWEGHQLRDFNYVSDVIAALLLAAEYEEANGRIYNLGAASIVSLKELAALLVGVNGGGEFQVHPFPTERKPIDIGDYYADFRLIQGSLGWTPTVSLRDGLGHTLDYYRDRLPFYL